MRRIRAAAADDGGWSLIESVVALAILAVVLTALGAGTLTVARASVNARTAQQAANILNQQVEQARSVEYAALTMVATDLAGDPRVSGSGPWTYLPTGERLVVDTVGSLAPHRVAEVRDSTAFAVARYVTDASSAAGALKRFTVVVTWDAHGQVKERQLSTLVSLTRRGLPLPDFTFALNNTSTPQPVGPETRLVWGLRVENSGARDSWNLTSDDGRMWTYVVDGDGDGVLDADETEQLPDADADADTDPDTGAIETHGVRFLLATRVLAAGETGSLVTTFVARSVAQPTAATAATSLRVEAVVGAAATPAGASCAPGSPCTLTDYHLDQVADGDTPSTQPLPLVLTPALQPGTPNYSTEAGPGAGRVLVPGGTGAQALADFRYQVPHKQTHSYGGTAALRTAVQCAPGRSVILAADLGASSNANGGTFTRAGAGSTALTCTGSPQQVAVTLPLTAPLATDRYVTVRLAAVAADSAPVRLLYDMSTADGVLTLPRLG